MSVLNNQYILINFKRKFQMKTIATLIATLVTTIAFAAEPVVPAKLSFRTPGEAHLGQGGYNYSDTKAVSFRTPGEAHLGQGGYNYSDIKNSTPSLITK
jgi:hypothetical protein